MRTSWKLVGNLLQAWSPNFVHSITKPMFCHSVTHSSDKYVTII